MDPVFSESHPILPRPLLYALAAVLIATLAFMAVMELFMNTDMPSWSLPVTAVIFVAIIILAAVPRMSITVSEGKVTVSYVFRKVEIGMDEVIDSRCGELTSIRSYAKWNLKGVKHRSYLCIGQDMGVAMKLLGKRVVVVSTDSPEELCALLPKDAGETPAEHPGEVVPENTEEAE